MNQSLIDLAKTAQPKIKNLDETIARMYRGGLMLLAMVTSEIFINLQKLPYDKYGTNGLFYNRPLLHEDMLYESGNTRDLIVVYRIQNQSSECPLHISITYNSIDNYVIHVYEQLGERPVKRQLVAKENGIHYTDIKDLDSITLRDLLLGTFETI